MANEIKALFGTTAQLTLTAASLASSATLVGRQSTLVDNTTTRWQKIHLYCRVTTGTSPTASRGIYVFLLKADKFTTPNVSTDNAGATDAAITIVGAQQIAGVVCDATSDKAYRFDCIISNPGPAWGIALSHETAVNLNATAGNHAFWWLGENPEVQ
jgi:hypothetical protein